MSLYGKLWMDTYIQHTQHTRTCVCSSFVPLSLLTRTLPPFLSFLIRFHLFHVLDSFPFPLSPVCHHRCHKIWNQISPTLSGSASHHQSGASHETMTGSELRSLVVTAAMRTQGQTYSFCCAVKGHLLLIVKAADRPHWYEDLVMWKNVLSFYRYC